MMAERVFYQEEPWRRALNNSKAFVAQHVVITELLLCKLQAEHVLEPDMIEQIEVRDYLHSLRYHMIISPGIDQGSVANN